jgi:hypothetical protein
MSMELANEKWLGHNPSGLLGQFASTRGYSDLISAAKKHKLLALQELFRHGVSGDVEQVRAELKTLAGLAPADVASTAKALRDLAEDQDMILITNGGN